MYILNRIKMFVPLGELGLYRDDGLIMIKQANGPNMERIRKKLHTTFRQEGLSITICKPSLVANFLDITLDINDKSYRPFRKENNITQYINKGSNHPPSIIRNIPDIVNRRINTISSNEEMFNSSKQFYEDALKSSGYNIKNLEFSKKPPDNNNTAKKKRGRNIIWYNPPYNADVTTNLGRKFFSLIEKHFPKSHRYSKFINRNQVKLSYSCMPNIRSIIMSHNKRLLEKYTTPQVKKR